MAYTPIANITFQYDEQKNWWLKFYVPNTTTPILMSIDSTGDTLLDKAQFDINGFPTTDGTEVFIPYLDQNYDAWVFPTAAEADANDTANAIRVAESINPFGDGIDIEIKKLPISVTESQTTLSIPDSPKYLNVLVDGAIYQQSNGDFTYSNGLVENLPPFEGGENVEVQYGLLAAVTGIQVDDIASFDSVAQMVASPDLSVGDKIITHMFNRQCICFWTVVSQAFGNGDMTDGTINLTGSSLQAKLQKLPVMTLEQFGAFGDSFTDDTNYIKGAFSYNVKLLGSPECTYLVTDQIQMPNNTDFDGQGCKFDWNGTAGPITYEGRDWGVFSAIGVLGSVIETSVLTSDIPEFTESTYPVNNDSAFDGFEDKYIFAFAGSTSSNPELPSFSVMPKFAGFSSAGNARLDYRLGWTIPSGLSITYRAVAPINGVRLKNFTIEDKSPTSGDSSDYASAISLAFAYNCHVSGVTGIKFRNPILFAQYCTDCTSKDGRVERPQETGGGQGYHTQWSYSLRCDTHKISGYLARHICDHTKSVYCNVSNCGDTNTADGAYTNHGSYEHDITYTNCIGWHSVGNSGVAFGESCKRINIINGNGSALTAGKNIIDLSVYNSRFGRVLANNQGFQADGLTVDDDGTSSTGFSLTSFTVIDGRNTLSLRPNTIKNSSILFNSGQVLTDASFTGRTVYLESTEIRKINSSFIMTGGVKMIGGSIEGTTAALSLVSDGSLYMRGTNTNSFGVRHVDGSNNGEFIVDGGDHSNIVITGFYSTRMTTGSARFELRNIELDGGSGIIIEMVNGSGADAVFMDISHNTFSNGTVNINANYAVNGKLFYTNNLDISSTVTIPATAGRILNTDNVSV